MSRIRAVRARLYRAASVLGDVQAAARGPVPLARRLARKRIYRAQGRLTARLLRKAGL